LHARALVRFAVVAVGTGNVKLVGDLLPRAVQVVFVGDLVSIDASRDVVFVEDDVVRERLVVDELNGFALGDRDGRREETEFTVVATQLDGGGERRVDHEDSRTNDGSLLHVLDEGRLGRLVDFVDLDSLRGKGLLDSEHFY